MERSKRAAATNAASKFVESEEEDADYEPVPKKRQYFKKPKNNAPAFRIIEEVPIEFDFGGNNQEASEGGEEEEGRMLPECFLEVNIQEQENEGDQDWDPLGENPSNHNIRQNSTNQTSGKPTINRFPCGYCDTVFTDSSFLIRHHKRCKAKRSSESSSSPRVPGPSFKPQPPPPPPQNQPAPDSNEMIEMYGFHRQIIKGKKMFCCNHCTFTTRNPDHLKYHKPIHNDDKQLSCDQCSFKCKDATHMQTHKKSHVPPEFLGEEFSSLSESDLLALQNTTKLFQCDQCNYTSTRPGYLVMHKRIHTRDQPYTCDDCGYKCSRLSYFNKHRLMHLPNGTKQQQQKAPSNPSESEDCEEVETID